jgi:hypothetical protein
LGRLAGFAAGGLGVVAGLRAGALAFAAGLLAGLAETVFLAAVGFADGFFAGMSYSGGLSEGRGIIQTERPRSTCPETAPGGLTVL